jgi:uncharacterized protein YtpQ (UPF0354 family)
VPILVAAVALTSGCSRHDLLTSREFTREFAQAIERAGPGVTVTVVRDLEVGIASGDGSESTCFLDNAYETYRLDPQEKDEVILRFAAAGLEALEAVGGGVDRRRIVPVIKDRAWLEETRQALVSRNAKEVPEHVFDEFGPDLVVVYAEDSPKNIRYLRPEDLERAGVRRSELRALAGENLARLLPPVERHGRDGLYMVTAGGTYEASLLLLDSIWKSGQMEVDGEVVVAIPTRDLLLVTGSENRRGLDRMRQAVGEAYEGGSYRLTRELFAYRNGRFEVFTGPAEVGGPESAPPSNR